MASDSTSSVILIVIAAVLCFLFMVAVGYYVYLNNKLKDAQGKYSQSRPSTFAPIRTLAEDEAELAKLEQQGGLLAWGGMESPQSHPEGNLQTFDEADLITPLNPRPVPLTLDDKTDREVFANPLFEEQKLLRNTVSNNAYIPSYSQPTLISKKDSESNLREARRRTTGFGPRYPASDVVPSHVTHKDWHVADPRYIPVNYTAPSVSQAKENVDPGIVSVLNGGVKFNMVDTTSKPAVNRVSHMGHYPVVDGLPRNPLGRQGVSGRGLLPRWGPNHAVDPIVTRWAMNAQTGDYVYRGGKKVLEVAVITQKDTGLIALPGGFVTANYSLIETLKQEFAVEAFGSQHLTESQQNELLDKLNTLFQDGAEIFRGLVEDPRNTDNAWIETIALHFHDESHVLPDFTFAGTAPGTATARWDVLSRVLKLSSGHANWLEEVAKLHDAFWTDKMIDAAVALPENDFKSPNIVYEGTIPGMSSPDTAVGGSLLSPRPPSRLDDTMRMTPGPNSPQNQTFDQETENILKSRLSPRAAPTTQQNEDVDISKRVSDFTRLQGEMKSDPFALTDMPPPATPDNLGDDARRPSQQHIVTSRASIQIDFGKGPTRTKHELVVGTFEAQYIGSVSTTNAGGEDVVAACIQAVKLQNNADQPDVSLVVSSDGIDVETISHGPSSPSKLLSAIPIREISFTSVDTANKRLFAFIANDPATKLLLCHVFLCKAKAKPVAEAVADAFKAAQAMRVDPFAISRETAGTTVLLDEPLASRTVDRALLKAKMIIGHGQFGKVYLADYADPSSSHPQVAVKLLKGDVSPEEGKEFFSEAVVMVHLHHPNILQLVGVCTEKRPWMMVAEFMRYKDLGLVLSQCLKNKVFLRPNEWLLFIRQVLDALLYLTEKRYLHRDIAARNVLLSESNTVKLGDFGLARKLPEGQDYWKLDKAGKLPVKYMSIETLTTKKFSQASEVWAFGVFMWELLSYGESPFEREGIENPEIKGQISNGFRLSQPAFHYTRENLTERQNAEIQANKIYKLCRSCWEASPTERPTFADLKVSTDAMLRDATALFPTQRDVGRACQDAVEAARERRDTPMGAGNLMSPGLSVRKKESMAFNDHNA